MPKQEMQAVQLIEKKILMVRGLRVMIDSDLAELYGVPVKMLIRSVNRNIERFPNDFMFQLSTNEMKSLRYQFGTSNKGRGGRRYLPYVFSENGVAMLSSVLHSKKAIHVNIQIMRVFTKIREWMGTHQDLQEKIKKLELKFDHQFSIVFEAIRKLIDRPVKTVRVKGFQK